VLLMSTDPAHSLGDVFGAAVGDRPAAVRGRRRIFGCASGRLPAAFGARGVALEAGLNEIVAAFGG